MISPNWKGAHINLIQTPGTQLELRPKILLDQKKKF